VINYTPAITIKSWRRNSHYWPILDTDDLIKWLEVPLIVKLLEHKERSSSGKEPKKQQRVLSTPSKFKC
jgi:hypothetical protein